MESESIGLLALGFILWSPFLSLHWSSSLGCGWTTVGTTMHPWTASLIFHSPAPRRQMLAGRVSPEEQADLVMMKSVGSGGRPLALSFLSMEVWANCLTSACLRCLICKVGIMVVPILYGCCENEMNQYLACAQLKAWLMVRTELKINNIVINRKY